MEILKNKLVYDAVKKIRNRRFFKPTRSHSFYDSHYFQNDVTKNLGFLKDNTIFWIPIDMHYQLDEYNNMTHATGTEDSIEVTNEIRRYYQNYIQRTLEWHAQLK